jgi:hypothetical protein
VRIANFFNEKRRKRVKIDRRSISNQKLVGLSNEIDQMTSSGIKCFKPGGTFLAALQRGLTTSVMMIQYNPYTSTPFLVGCLAVGPPTIQRDAHVRLFFQPSGLFFKSEPFRGPKN